MKQQGSKEKSKFFSLQSAVLSLQSSVYGLRSSVSSRIPHSKAAFSLMEMLVVIAVIGILMGLLFPALMGVRERSRSTRARSEVQTLQEAWLAYWNTYGQTLGWPSTSGKMDPDAVAVLAGVDTAANPQHIAFMEFDARDLRDGFKDPWGNWYQVKFGAEKELEKDWNYQTRVHCINSARDRY